MPDDGFNLRMLIREVADSSTIADPARLAEEVARRISSRDRAAALEQALPTLVQHVVSRRRVSLDMTDAFPAHTPAPGSSSGGAVSEAHSAAQRPSSKVAGIRETWRRMLRDRIAVGPERGDWKFLGDCTIADLQFASSIREEHARRNAARAEQLRDLADRLGKSGVETVGQLPDSDLGDALGAAA